MTDGLLVTNPAERAHRRPDSPEMPTWSAEQVRTFLGHLADDHVPAMWRLAATTGVRRGELVGLRWRDVDLGAGRVSVLQQRAKSGGSVEMGPTTSQSSASPTVGRCTGTG